MRGKSREEVSLLDVLVDGFEKNEVIDGWHWRDLPMSDEDSARHKFSELVEEAARWKGAPSRTTTEATRQLAGWSDLEIRQAGRAVMIRARAPWFDTWWHDKQTWAGDPMGAIHAWLAE
jgi:hypothetical protein